MARSRKRTRICRGFEPADAKLFARAMMAFRYVVIFLWPFVLFVLFHYVTHELRASAWTEASEITAAISSPEREIAEAMARRLATENMLPSVDWLKRLEAGTVLLGATVTAWFFVARPSPTQLANYITVVVVGFCMAKALNFSTHLSWLQYSVWLAVGLTIALLILAYRRSKIRQDTEL